jgi:hypothetical protein
VLVVGLPARFKRLRPMGLLARSMLASVYGESFGRTAMKKFLATLAAVGLCTSVLAQSIISDGTSSTIISRDGSTIAGGTITSRDGSTVSPGNITSRDGRAVTPNGSSGNTGSVILDNQSSVTSSMTTDSTGTTTSSIVGSTGSMCSAVNEGQRCEISCRAPRVAQCAKGDISGEPACFCR